MLKLDSCLDFCGGVLICWLHLMTLTAPEPTQRILKKEFTLSLSEVCTSSNDYVLISSCNYNQSFDTLVMYNKFYVEPKAQSVLSLKLGVPADALLMRVSITVQVDSP